MFIFIISIVLVSFISLCFFKKNFWENRYLVLLICVGVATIATLTTNYIVRDKLKTTTAMAYTTPMFKFNLPDTLKSDWDFKKSAIPEIILKCSSISQNRAMSIYFYGNKKNLKVGFVKEHVGFFGRKTKQIDYEYFKNIYIAPNNSDTTAFIGKVRLLYDVNENNWITGFTFPVIAKMRCLYIPPTEYALLPDSLKRKLPF